MQMDEKRQGEIALKLVRNRLIKNGLQGEGFQRELGNAAKDIGVEVDELKEFYEALLPDVIGKMLGRKSVSLTISH